MAFFPSWAQAEEATGPQYETEIPTVPSQESSPPAHHKHSGGSKGSSEEGGEASKSGAPSGGGNNGGSNTGGGTNVGQRSQGQNGEGGQNGGGGGHADQSVQKAKPISTLGEPAGHTEEGSSSPLVPILIAIAVLAAISIGAFFYRQRRQDSTDSPVSPKAS